MKKRLLCLILTIILIFSYAFQTDVQAADRPEEEFNGYLVRLAESPGSMSRAALNTVKNLEMVSEGLCLTEDLQTARALVGSGLAEFYEPNYILTLQDTPFYSPSQWNLLAVKVQAAWNSLDSQGLPNMLGDDVTVAVIDSGIYREHPDFKAENILEQYDLASNTYAYHGTFVTGIIAAQVNNSIGIDGVAANVKIMPINVTYNSNGNADVATIIKAIDDYALEKNADVINLSMGSTNYSEFLKEACQRAVDAGIIVVASAGNYLSGQTKSPDKYMYPASYDCVVSVSACKQDGHVTSGSAIKAVFDGAYSYFNDQVTVAAPGTGILSLYMDDGTKTDSGTSFSAPMVSAMAAMAKQRNKALSPADFITLLSQSTDDLGQEGFDPYYGNGFVNIKKFAETLDKSYRITFNKGDGASFDQTITVPDTYSLSSTTSSAITLPEPSRSGDEFRGWYENADFFGSPVTEIPSGSIGDKIYYAAWESDWLMTGTAQILVSNGTYSDPDFVDPGDSLSLRLTLDNDKTYGGTTSWYEGDRLLASGDTYTVEIHDAGKTIHAVYTAPQGWFGTIAAAPVRVERAVLGGLLLIEQTADIKIGDILSLKAESIIKGKAVQDDDTDYGLQWLRDGKAISGETYKTYMVKKEDRGHKISITAQAKGEFYKGSVLSEEVRAEIGRPSVTLTVTPGDKQAAISWKVTDNGGSPVTKFIVYKDDILKTTLPASSASYTFTGLENGVSYNFRLEAYNTALDGSQQYGSAEVSCTPLAPEGGQTNPGSGGISPGGGGGGAPMAPAALFYTIKATAGRGGSISPATSEIEAGGSQTFTIIPDEGYEVSSVLVKGQGVGAVSSYTFTNVNEDSAIEAVFAQKIVYSTNSNGFIDVDKSDWFAQSVDYVVNLGLFKGTTDDTFSPYASMTRAMFVTVLGRLHEYMNKNSLVQPEGLTFTDVPLDRYYAASVQWASDNNIIKGYEGGLFKPEEPISREQIVAILYRFALYAGLDTTNTSDITTFADSGNISSWSLDALKWAVGSGILGGRTDGSLDPQGLVQRCEVAAILNRFIK